MSKRVSVFAAVSVILLITGVLLAVSLGAKRLPFETVASALFKGGDSLDIKLIREVRLPRAIAAVLTGGMLASAGAVMQGVTRNPLAEPSIMGMTQGASLAVAAASVILAFWVAGGFKSITWGHVWLLLFAGGISLILFFFLAGSINILRLGDEAATGLGVRPERIRLWSILLLIPVCAVCVASAGNIAFVGLVIPHMIRKIFDNDYRRMIPLSFLGGSVLMVWADLAARLANQPYETPVGLFTSILGVPVFLWLIRKEQSR